MAAVLSLAPVAPAQSATVIWAPNSDGFWDISANWSPGLPEALDDVIIDVGGPTVRTITFRTNIVTVNSLASKENLFVTGGELTISNSYTNTAESRISGGTLRLNGTSTMAAFTQSSGTLTGSGVLTVTGAATYGGSATQTGSGSTIHTGAVSFNPTVTINLDEGRLLEFRGGATTGTSWLSVNVDFQSPKNGGTLRNAVGSTFLDQTASFTQFSSSWGGGSFENLGTYRKTGTSTTGINVAFTNAGVVQVEAGTFRVQGALTGASGSTLSGGTWVAVGPGLIDFETGAGLSSLVTNAADLTLSGTGSRMVSGSGNLDLEATLTTNAAAGALRLLDGRSYTATAGGGAFTNAGLLQLGGGTFTAASLANAGTIEGFGTVAVAITNTGSTVRALGGTLATRQITGGGSVAIAPGASLDMTAAPAGSSVATLAHDGAALLLGTQNISVRSDYRNAAFGLGDAFDPRANVSGSGQILATSATQILSAAGLVNGATATPTLDLGNLRIGESATVTVTISNTGTETTLRGAVKGAAAPGVTVLDGGSFVVEAGGTTSFVVTTVGGAPGNLAGQSITVANNFANVDDQVVALLGGVFRPADAAISPNPLSLGNVRRGSTASGLVSITNTAPDDGFSEGLRIVSATPADGAIVIATPGGVIAPSASAGATLGIETGAAGARSGTVTIAFETDGTGTSGLPSAIIGDKVVTVTANVFALANPTVDALPGFGNARVGDVVTQTVTVRNTLLPDTAAAFQEGLDASVAGTTGAFSGAGAIVNLAAGSTDSGAISFTMNTATAGSKAGTGTLGLATNGTGTSGLAPEALAGQTIELSGAVYRVAQQAVTGGGTVNVRVGAVGETVITINNLAVNDGFSEGLGVTGTATGSGVTFSDPTALVAAAGSKTVTASFDTAAAGQKTGTLSLSFTSDGTGTSGLAPIGIGSQDVSVAANVFALANPVLLADLAFGNVIQGSAQTKTITVTNALVEGVPVGFQEGLNASFGAITTGFSGAGAITNLTAGFTDNVTLVVTLDTSSAGARNGTVQVLLASNGASTSGLGLFGLGDVVFEATANIEGSVFRLAQADVAPLVVDFGNRRVGDAAPASVALTITNTAIDDGFSERLDASVGATTGRATGAGSISLLAPETSSNAVAVGIDTSSAGANGTVQILLASNCEGTSGGGISPLAPQTVVLGGGVYRLAEADVAPTMTVIVARVGDAAGTTITITNTALADGYSEGLGVSATPSGDGVSFGPAGGLIAAGGKQTVTATVDTTSAGVKTGTLNLAFTSDGTGTSGLAAIGIDGATASVEAQVYATAVASVTPTVIDFGVVRVGDMVAAQDITVLNGAVGTLADTLVTGAGDAPAGFSVSGAPGPLAAGESGNIIVSLNTGTAGSFGGDLTLGFISRNPELADLALDNLGVTLVGTVNNLAAPAFTRFGVELAFDPLLQGYVFDLGSVIQGGMVSLAGFGLGNLVFGPADDLSGLVTDQLGGAFSLGGAFDVGLLSAGQVSAPFSIFFNSYATGSFMGELSFAGLGTNASDPVGLGVTSRLFLKAQVNPGGGGVIPEPGTWAMMIVGFGAIGAGLRRRRQLIAA
ncbi:MAG: choice-of-anchor D domain-containing protein [Sphingomonadaceae bacterium]